jgi:hypothetical protein
MLRREEAGEPYDPADLKVSLALGGQDARKRKKTPDVQPHMTGLFLCL